jgi:hypothetical protein
MSVQICTRSGGFLKNTSQAWGKADALSLVTSSCLLEVFSYLVT